MSNKTISINPLIFSTSATKTKKQRDKKSRDNTIPLISPNVLKNKLLKRIKEHKQKETEHLENNKRRLTPQIVPSNDKESIEFTDEFTDSIQYLQTLAKQKKTEEVKVQQEAIKQKQKEELERRTIRNYHAMTSSSDTPSIYMDLPNELEYNTQPLMSDPITIQPKDDVPYGVLKGGVKPSYREWTKTQKNLIVTNPQASLIIDNTSSNLVKTARENRLQLLKQKIKNKTESMTSQNTENEILIRKPTTQIVNEATETTNHIDDSSHNLIQTNNNQSNNIQSNVNTNGGVLIGTKHITKKTIKRKYTLGRSRVKKTVSVLIKDRGTRKKILNAQKDLKRKNINDIKAYLRDHNLIKTGSNAPSDVLRKLYESAMLTGEITNSNPDTLLHNFSKDDKQL